MQREKLAKSFVLITSHMLRIIIGQYHTIVEIRDS